MAFPPEMDDNRAPRIDDRTRVKSGVLAVAIGVFAGFLGVGPGFLMVPSLVILGYSARVAAATNSVIVTLPSFSAFVAHLGAARFDWLMLAATSVAAVLGAQAGAVYMSRRMKSPTLSRVFAVVLLALAVQRVWVLLVG
jgi:uncharacterized membrane protein YfcA